MSKRWSNDEIETLINLRDNRKTLVSIGNILNRSEGSVQIMLRRLGKTKNYKWTDEDIKKIIELYNSGLNFKEIGIIVGKTQSSITNKLNRMGLKSNYQPEKSFKNQPKGLKYQKINWKLIQDEYDSGLSYNEISEKFKLSSNAIIWGKNNGLIKFRSVSDSLKLAWKNGKYPKSNAIGIKRYRQLCEFDFNLKKYSDKFNFELIKKHGWYKAKNCGNNSNGINRDHMYSIKDGFLNNVNPIIIKHPANCELLLHQDNLKKHGRSSITLNELLERIKHWDISPHADKVNNVDSNPTGNANRNVK